MEIQGFFGIQAMTTSPTSLACKSKMEVRYFWCLTPPQCCHHLIYLPHMQKQDRVVFPAFDGATALSASLTCKSETKVGIFVTQCCHNLTHLPHVEIETELWSVQYSTPPSCLPPLLTKARWGWVFSVFTACTLSSTSLGCKNGDVQHSHLLHHLPHIQE